MENSHQENRFFEQELRLENYPLFLASDLIQQMEKCVNAHNLHLGLTPEYFDQIQHQLVIKEIQTERKSFYGEALKIRTWVKQTHELYVVRITIIYCQKQQNTIWINQSKWGCLDLKTKRLNRLPPTVFQIYKANECI